MSETNFIKELRLNFAYEPETGLIVRKTSRAKAKAGSIATKKHARGYLVVHFGKPYMAHRIAWALHHGTFPEKFIDHINCIRDDNRISNLRIADKGQNAQNQQSCHANNKSGFLGVHKVGKNKWRAQIRIDGEKKGLGRYTSPEAAHAAYINAKRKFHEYGQL